jgi:chromatin modification-related protein VID21
MFWFLNKKSRFVDGGREGVDKMTDFTCVYRHQRPFDENTLPQRRSNRLRNASPGLKTDTALLGAKQRSVTRSRSPLKPKFEIDSPKSKSNEDKRKAIGRRQNGDEASSLLSPDAARRDLSGEFGQDAGARSARQGTRQPSALTIVSPSKEHTQLDVPLRSDGKTPITPGLSSTNSLPTPTPSSSTSQAVPHNNLPPTESHDDLPASPTSTAPDDIKSPASSQGRQATSTSSVGSGDTPVALRHSDPSLVGASDKPTEDENARHTSSRQDVNSDEMDVDDDEVVIVPTTNGSSSTQSTTKKADAPVLARINTATGNSSTPIQVNGVKPETPTTSHTHTRSYSREDLTMEDSAISRQSMTPARTIPPTPTERMTTRGASGAIRHKSVSEILGEPIKASPSPNERSERSSAETSKATSGAATPQMESLTPLMSANRDKSKLSTVVFANKSSPVSGDRPTRLHAGHASSKGPARDKIAENRDYLELLFETQAAVHPLENLLKTANKTISTLNHYANIHEMQDIRVLRKIHHLQANSQWSFRQIERAVEPPREATHWDMLLDEMKWMRTDFREERKWKMAAAKNLADACAAYVAASPEEQQDMRVKVTARKEADPLSNKMDVDSAEHEAEGLPTPELVHSSESDSVNDHDELPPLDVFDTVAPAAIFSLSGEDIVFGMKNTPAAKNMLDNLPLYEPFKMAQSRNPDYIWRAEVVPVSKYVNGKMIVKDFEPPQKFSRFDYELEEDEQSEPPKKKSRLDYSSQMLLHHNSLSKSPSPYQALSQPQMKDVALFQPDHRQLRDRFRANHVFKIPSDFNMPSVQFYENRIPSQWMQSEDDELKKLVKEYSYNWPLISSIMAPRSNFSAASERRTPWECFERWVSLEGVPTDMQKTALFRAFFARLDAPARGHAQQLLQAQAALAASNGNSNSPVVRKRNTQSMRVERRKNTRHLAMFDAMRKLAKKRESQKQKQEQGKIFDF